MIYDVLSHGLLYPSYTQIKNETAFSFPPFSPLLLAHSFNVKYGPIHTNGNRLVPTVFPLQLPVEMP